MSVDFIYPSVETMRKEIREYAADNKCYLEEEGEVGFGRECVGIVHNSSYPSYSWEDTPGRYDEGWHTTDEARPPEGVVDAYHKHNCLAVLGRGSYALAQLWLWVKSLKENDVVVVVEDRNTTDLIDFIMHGSTRALLKVKADA